MENFVTYFNPTSKQYFQVMIIWRFPNMFIFVVYSVDSESINTLSCVHLYTDPCQIVIGGRFVIETVKMGHNSKCISKQHSDHKTVAMEEGSGVSYVQYIYYFALKYK